MLQCTKWSRRKAACLTQDREWNLLAHTLSAGTQRNRWVYASKEEGLKAPETSLSLRVQPLATHKSSNYIYILSPQPTRPGLNNIAYSYTDKWPETNKQSWTNRTPSSCARCKRPHRELNTGSQSLGWGNIEGSHVQDSTSIVLLFYSITSICTTYSVVQFGLSYIKFYQHCLCLFNPHKFSQSRFGYRNWRTTSSAPMQKKCTTCSAELSNHQNSFSNW